MSLINIISVPTAYGIKTIEIHNDDITKFCFNIDLLVLSAYHNKYFPAPNTVIKSLFENTGIVLEELALAPKLDMRSSLNCWVSEELGIHSIKQVLCIEGIKTSIKESGSSEDALSNLFGAISLLRHKKLNVRNIALPLLGTGFQNNSMESVLPVLIEKAIDSLSVNPSLNTIYFIELNKEKASLIDESLNNYLNRSPDKLELVIEDPIVKGVLDIVLGKLMQIKNNYSFYRNKSLRNLINKINNKNFRFFELGILCRKILELLLADISDLKSDKYVTIFEYINDIKSKNVADWMITYLHTLRVFGNSVAHDGESNEIPDHMEKTDLIVFVYAFDRFLDLYIRIKNKSN